MMRVPPTPELLAHLQEILGPGGFLTDPADQLAYLKDERGRYLGRTPLVARPADTASLSAVMTACYAAGVAMVPQGGHTGLVGGGTPFEQGDEIVISLKRMNRIRAIDPVGDTITVEAGATLQAVQAAAAAVDRLYPVSLASEGSCTIGGTLATNAGGIHVLRYGNSREQVLGLEVVLPDGRVWEGLRALRKDNTGTDLKQLFIGTEGTLGIITAAVLRLRPRDAGRAVGFAAVADLDAALALLALARAEAAERLTAFELLSETGLGFTLALGPGRQRPLATVAPWYLLFEIGGRSAEAEAMAERLLASAFDRGLVLDGTLAASEAQAEALWRLREDMSESQKPQGGSLKHDISLPLAALPDFVRAALAAVEARLPGIRPCCFGHLGDGNLHFNLSQPIGADRAAFMARTREFAELIHDLTDHYGGSISAEHGLGRLKIDEITRYHSPVEQALKAEVKRAFDPQGLLNPGKVVRV